MIEETNSKGWGEVAAAVMAVNKSWKNNQFLDLWVSLERRGGNVQLQLPFFLEILISFYDY